MLDQDALPDASMKLTSPMSGVEGSYVKGLTHLTGVSGNATLLGDTFTANFDGGRVGNLIVRGGHALIPTCICMARWANSPPMWTARCPTS